jgi:predicted TIM-barrel fold metal-dependent hydrolase
MTIDGQTYIGDSIQGFSQTADDLRRIMHAVGIDRSVICPVKPRSYHLWPENERIAELAQRFPDEFIGFARVDPRLGAQAVEGLERALGELQLKGLLLHPWEETFRINSPLVDPLLRTAEAHGIPVLIETGYPWLSEALQVRDLALRFPQVPIMMTHGGQINISGLGQRDAWLTLNDCPNVTMHTSGVYREDFIEEVIEQIGADRVIFGSGAPLLDARLEILRVRMAHIDAGAKGRVLGENLRRLLPGVRG